ncbi:MAG: glycoside hydrolase family 28 protein, partial [Oxalobacteraceae bacterium]
MTPSQSARRSALQRILITLGSTAACTVGAPATALAQGAARAGFDVRAYGARGDGATLDTDAINAAIAAAGAAGGGTVWFPAGRYLSFSIRLRSNVALYL